MKKTIFIVAVVLLALIGGIFLGGRIGIPQDKIFNTQMDSMGDMEGDDLTGIGESIENWPIEIGLIYAKDYSRAKYYIYTHKSGLYLGWFPWIIGDLTEEDGLVEFDFGERGKAYFALNSNNKITKSVGSVTYPNNEVTIKGPIADLTEGNRIFYYDKDGNEVMPSESFGMSG